MACKFKFPMVAAEGLDNCADMAMDWLAKDQALWECKGGSSESDYWRNQWQLHKAMLARIEGRKGHLFMPNAALTGGETVPALVGQGYRVNSDEWWTFDTEKYDFFHEQCCDCGLNHKTHVRLEGTKIHFRHERRDRPPTPDEIDNTDLPNARLDRQEEA
jgi:hypothetical protein